jgi:hypothetical protein
MKIKIYSPGRWMPGLAGRAMLFVGVALTAFLFQSAVHAQLIYTGAGTDPGAISFGVSGYGLPQPGVPTYIANNFDGLNDILASPGGTFLTANPVVANNIFSIANTAPMFGFQAGGGNANGNFGSGSISITGPGVQYALSDSGAGGGSASYGIASWDASFSTGAAGANNFGAYLSIGGSLTAVGEAGVAALRIHISDTGGVFGAGGVDLAPMVLANSLVGVNTYSWVALGGSGAAMLTDAFGNFRGLAIDNVGALPAFDTISAIATLTIYADPMSIDSIAPDLTLIDATGTTLPSDGIAMVPEPAAPLLAGAGLLAALIARKVHRRAAA